MVRIFSKLNRPDESQIGIALITGAPPERVVRSHAERNAQKPGYELVEPAEAVEIGGLPGAVTRVRYQLSAGSGAPQVVEARLWFVRQGMIAWYIDQLGPAPLSPEVDAQFRAIVDSIRLEPAL
jgi:hypothetical protein